jgi:hypothetical protein
MRLFAIDSDVLPAQVQVLLSAAARRSPLAAAPAAPAVLNFDSATPMRPPAWLP